MSNPSEHENTAHQERVNDTAGSSAAGDRERATDADRPVEKPLHKEKQHEPFARAATEDDDGYDPWSDRVVQEPFWEKDPWN